VRALFLNGLALGVGLILSFMLLEGVLWVVGQPPAGPFLQSYDGDRFRLMCYRENPSGDMKVDLRIPAVRDGYARRMAQTDFATTWRATPFCNEIAFNSQGYREREIGPKAAGVCRIGALGDSFTYGHGLAESAPFPRRLEALLRERFGDGRFEVLDLGRGGLNLPALADWGDSALRQMDLDVLIYAYYLNDGTDLEGLHEPEGVTVMMRAGWTRFGNGTGRTSVGERSSGFPRSLRIIKRMFEQRRLTHATIEYYRWVHNSRNWPKIAAFIARMKAAADARGTRFVVVPLPIPFRIAHDYPYADVHAAILADLRSRQIEAINVLPSLARYDDAALRLHPEDLHPNSRYDDTVARALLEEASRCRMSSDSVPRQGRPGS